LAVSYEGDSGNEFWISYLPDRRLDLTWWHAVVRDRAALESGGGEPVSREEFAPPVERLGDAVRAAATLDDDVEEGRFG
jgi:hypothetical protein